MKLFKERFAEHCDCTESCCIDDYEMGCGRCKDVREEGWRWAFEAINKAIDSEMSFQDIIILVKDELGEQS